jgi:protein-S-isoprenylcysteine O-methyltransferase Ste14
LKVLENYRGGATISEWKDYILGTIAGVLTVVQIILSFFLFNSAGMLILWIIGGVFWMLSIVFGWLPIYILRKEGGVPEGKSYIHTTVLVDSGVYGLVRHPQFLGWIFLNIALIFITQNWIIAILGVVSAIIIGSETRNADKSGIEKFGNDYKYYMQSVPRINFLLGIIRHLRRRNKSQLPLPDGRGLKKSL